MNEYFVNITQILDMPVFPTKGLHVDIECIEPIDEIICNFCRHQSIIKISNIIKPTERFSFNKVDQMQIEKQILQLNAKTLAEPRTSKCC